jgi:dihydrodipicolinate synthase/N-acetylneuraminate lyase
MEGIGAKIECTGAATVFQANAPFMLESILRGAGGIMAIITTAAADLTIDFWKAAREQRTAGGDPAPAALPRATTLHEQLVLLDCALGRGGAYPASAKYLATLRGPQMGLTCRAPSVAVPEVRKALEVWYTQAVRSGVLRPR